jgi:ABC-type spermidine/putrescine transport system permease subunit II
MGDSAMIVVLGHTARFGFVPVLIGAFLARSERPDERDSRRLDGAEGLRGWSLACLPGGAGTVAAAGLAAGVLAFHEIESAVILQPAGLDSFPRQMLAFLHFFRRQELCCGALLTIGVGVAGGVLAVVCDGLAGVRWRR